MKIKYAIFYTTDLQRIKNFYLDLGFKLAPEQKGKVISFVFDNDTILGIKLGDKEREVPGTQTVIISVDNIQVLYEKIKSGNYNIYKALIAQDWGTSFSILDPDGNKAEFMESV